MILDGNGMKARLASLQLKKQDRIKLLKVRGISKKITGGVKKIKTRDEYLKVSSDDLWKVRAKLDGKKRSLAKTYKTSKEMNDKVCMLNQQMGKHLETLALLYENFEQACNEKRDAEEQFDKDFYSVLEILGARRKQCSEASTAYDNAEAALNEGLGLVRCQFRETSLATLALTQGTQARGSNELYTCGKH